MRVVVAVISAGMVAALAAPVLAEEPSAEAVSNAEAIAAEHLDNLPDAPSEADAGVVIDHAASRVVDEDNHRYEDERRDSASNHEVVETRLVRRYRVDADGRRHIEYNADEREVRSSRVRRVRTRDHDHHHALDSLAVGLAIGLPFAAYHSYDRYRPSRHHRYGGHRGQHRKYRRHHRRW